MKSFIRSSTRHLKILTILKKKFYIVSLPKIVKGSNRNEKRRGEEDEEENELKKPDQTINNNNRSQLKNKKINNPLKK